jgi:hypothetical protein
MTVSKQTITLAVAGAIIGAVVASSASPWAQSCADCAVRTHAICAPLDQDELRELEQPGHRLQYCNVGNSKEYFEAVAI